MDFSFRKDYSQVGFGPVEWQTVIGHPCGHVSKDNTASFVLPLMDHSMISRPRTCLMTLGTRITDFSLVRHYSPRFLWWPFLTLLTHRDDYSIILALFNLGNLYSILFYSSESIHSPLANKVSYISYEAHIFSVDTCLHFWIIWNDWFPSKN